jgi:transcriptional regulator with GAF, ATPase, and Fis domain
LLETNRWPGNVRELRNAIERAAILSRGGRIGAEELSAGDWAKGKTVTKPRDRHSGDVAAAAPATLAEAEARHIVAALDRCQGKLYGPGGAAEALGLKPSTLQSRMKKLGIRRKD